MENQTWNNTYPRPQLKRNSFFTLNGEWLLNGHPIQIPFPPQSPLSQYNQKINDVLIYEKSFTLPEDFYKNKQVILHFGAIDQVSAIHINDNKIGYHVGGYLPFSFNITNYLLKGENKLKVKVVDSLSHDYPYGKQKKNNGGMWYTPVSGIWQSVWIEAVPLQYIEDLKITANLTSIHLDIKTNSPNIKITIPLSNKIYTNTFTTKKIDIDLSLEDDKLQLWTPDHPYLYPLIIETDEDYVESYFALRTISIRNSKVYLNNQSLFFHGVLDQGYFHDGLFLPKEPYRYVQDVLNMKELGFNTLRKHIKIEPEIFYYICDKYGMLIIQDMVNNGEYSYLFDTVLPNIGLKYRPDRFVPFSRYRKMVFFKHVIETLNHLHNHPCIVTYTLFNEGWGQFNSDKIYRFVKNLDNSRLYDSTSGWFKQKESDFDSQHIYFQNKILSTKSDKPILLSECGGYTYYIKDHVYNNKKKSYGYGKTSSKEELTDKIIKLYDEMVIPSIKNNLCGCIYTQLSDIEDEINGLYTYDRKICKVDKEKMISLSHKIQKSKSLHQ